MSMDRDTFVREVDEELQRERLERIWKDYGNYIIGAVVAVLAGIGIYKYMESRRIAAAESAGLRYEAALELVKTGKTDEAMAAFSALSAASPGSYPALAQLAAAGQAAKAGKTDQAVTGYELAAGRASDQLMKDFARLQTTALKIDSTDFTEVQNRLTDLLKDSSPWRYLAREQLALAALRAGRVEDVRTTLGPVTQDANAPAALRDRATAILAVAIGLEQERAVQGKVEMEKTDPPAADATQKPDPARAKSAPAKGAVAPRSK